MTDTSSPLALIVEDDEKLAEIFTQAMQLAGFNTQSVSDGNAALDTLNQSQPAVLVLDLHLPGVSGDKILQFVRGDERLKSIQVIVATADATMADSLQELSDLVLIKPITFTQLRTLAARLRKGMN